MALDATLKLDMSKARADILELGQLLRRELTVTGASIGGGRGGSALTANLRGATNELKQFQQDFQKVRAEADKLESSNEAFRKIGVEAGKASTEIKRLSQIDLEKTVAKELDATARAARGAERESNLLGDSWQKLARRAAALVGAREVFNFFRDTQQAASDAVESVNAVEKVFDESVAPINAFVEEQAELLGFGANQAREAAVQYGGLFQAFQFGKEESAELSIELTKIAADLASIYNADPSDAVRALSGIFRGEPEPARRFGLNITAAAMANEALRLGLIETRSEMTENIKAQATYSLILQQTDNIIGDFADTLDTSLPNQLRVLRAEFQNFQISLGEQFRAPLIDAVKLIRSDLLPSIRTALESVNFESVIRESLPPFVRFVEIILEQLPRVLEAALQLGSVFADLATILVDLFELLPDGIQQFALLAAAAQRVSASGSEFGGGIVFAIDALRRLTAEGRDATDVVIGFGEAAAVGFAQGGLVGAGLGVAAAGVTTLYSTVREEQRRTAAGTQAYIDATLEADSATRSVDERIRFLAEAYREVAGDASDAADEVLGTVPALEAMRAAIDEGGTDRDFNALLDFEATIGGLESLAELAATGTDIFNEAGGGFQDTVLRGVFDPNTGAWSQDNLERAIEQLREIARTTDDPRIRAGVDAFLDYAEAVDFNEGKLLDLAEALDFTADRSDDARKKIEAESKAELERAVLLGEIPSIVRETALAYQEQGDSFPFTRALEEYEYYAELAAIESQTLLAAIGEFERTVPAPVDRLKELASAIDGNAVSARDLVAALDGPVRDAVQGFLDNRIFAGGDAVDLAELIDAEGFDDRLRELGIDIQDFIDTTEATVNENSGAIDLSELFSDALTERLANIESQLEITFDIDEDNDVDDVREATNQVDKVLDDFNSRRAAAAQLRLFDLEDLAQEVEQGRLDEIVDNVLDGLSPLEDLTALNDSLIERRTILEAASEETAFAYLNAFSETLNGGTPALISTWIQSFELEPEDFLAFGRDFIDSLTEAIGADGVRKLQMEQTARDVVAGFEAGIEDGTVDVVAAMRYLGLAGVEAVEDEWETESPSKVARKLGLFWDEGLAQGIESGRSVDAAKRRAEEIAGIFERLADTDLSSAFDVSDTDFTELRAVVDLYGGLDAETIFEEVEIEDPTDNLAEIAENIRAQTKEAVDAANAELELLFDRDRAIERLRQFGDFSLFEEFIGSGAADANLRDIIYAPSEAAFAQIEADLQRAGDIFDTARDALPSNEEGRLRGLEFELSVLEGQAEGYETGQGPLYDVLGSSIDSQIRFMEDKYGLGSPSDRTEYMGEMLAAGLQVGWEENASIDPEIVFADFDEEAIVDAFYASGEAAAIAFMNGLGEFDFGVPGFTPNSATPDEEAETEFVASLDTSSLDDAQDTERIARYTAVVDATELEALEVELLNIRGILTIEEIIDETANEGLDEFDAGGVAYRRSIFAEKRPEFAAGPHHAPEQVVKWMDQLRMSEGVARVLLDRYRVYDAPPQMAAALSPDITVKQEPSPQVRRMMDDMRRAMGRGQLDDIRDLLEQLNASFNRPKWRL